MLLIYLFNYLLGNGHTANYLDPTKVTRYIALEPNVHMHAELRKRANAAGFTEADGTFLLLSFGAQDIDSICAAGGGTQQIDTIVSILTLCSVPDPIKTIYALLEKGLKPGGSLLFHEHVRNTREDVAWWQGFWNPVWGMFFGGCKMNRPTDVWINKWPGWEERSVFTPEREAEEPERFFCHRVGQYVKAKAS